MQGQLLREVTFELRSVRGASQARSGGRVLWAGGVARAKVLRWKRAQCVWEKGENNVAEGKSTGGVVGQEGGQTGNVDFVLSVFLSYWRFLNKKPA